MSIDRRNFFKFAGGSAVGLALTPVPWTLLDDTAKWSQNWSWIARPPKGEIRTRFTTCTLCPAGCGVRARCVGGQPVSLAGVAAHPSSRGALCPVGLAGHHQAYHPRRVKQALYRGRPVAIAEAVEGVRAAIAGAAGKGPVALLDLAPGRAHSAFYRRFAASCENGIYLAAEPAEGAWLRALAQRFEKPFGPLGLDLEKTRAILSFSTPILDGWGTPGRVLKQRANFRLLQVESELSRTAALADVWLPIRPGTESTLALALAHVLTEENLYDPACRRAADFHSYVEMAARYTPEYAAPICGVPPERIVETARDLADQESVLVVGEDAAGLNLLLGSVGRTIVRRRGAGLPSALSPEKLEDGGISVLIAAGEFPWQSMAGKLAPGATVVNLSPWNDGRAEFVIPAPVYLESIQDVPTPFDAKTDTLSLSAPLVPPPAGVIEPADFLARLDPSLGKPEDALNARIAAVYKTRRGAVISYKDGSSTPLQKIPSPDDLRKSLLAGAVWVDTQVSEAPVPRFTLVGNGRLPRDSGTARCGWRGVPGLAVSPILSKLYQESGLRNPREA